MPSAAERMRLRDGMVAAENRDWEEGYRQRWQHDKIVRSTHGVNCTGSCSWKVYVKNGLITWETQQTDYPRTRPDLPNHEPRGCSRGASYSWYLYSANRVKYPLVRSRNFNVFVQAGYDHKTFVDTPAAGAEVHRARAQHAQGDALGGRRLHLGESACRSTGSTAIDATDSLPHARQVGHRKG